MSSRLRTIGVASLVAAIAFAFQAATFSPHPPTPNEIDILQATAQLGSGSPGLFFQAGSERWLQPIPVYATALWSLVVPAELAARHASASAGAVAVALMFVLAGRLFTHPLAPSGAALLLLLSPAYFVHARLGTDAVYLLPFVLAWLICLIDYLRDGRTASVVAGAVALGAGAYSQPTAPLTMMFLLAVTLVAVGAAGRLNARSAVIPIAAFTLALLPAVAWFAAHPQSYADTYGRWVIHAAHLRFPLDAVRAFFNWTTLGTRVSLYWGFFDPSWLFFDGPAAPLVLRGSAPFVFGTLVLLASGVRWTLMRASAGLRALLLGGLAVSPLAASTFGEPHALHGAMATVPLVLVLATAGAADLLNHRSRGWRALAWVAMGACVIDFAAFYLSYFG